MISALSGLLLTVGSAAAQQDLRLPEPGQYRPLTAPAPTPVPARTPPIQPTARKIVNAVVQETEDTITYPTRPKTPRTIAQMGGRTSKLTEESIDFAVRTELPDPGELFQRVSEQQLFDRIRQEARKFPGSGRVTFPQEPVIGKGPYEGRKFHRMMETVEPSYVCHGRLFFEQPNFERHTWSLGAFQPAAHLLIFYYDMVMLPYHIWERPCQDYDCNAGKCLPGDPTPLLLYREHFSLSGMAAEIGTFWGGAFMFR